MPVALVAAADEDLGRRIPEHRNVLRLQREAQEIQLLGNRFLTLNTIVRALAIGLDAYIAQFLRYLCGLIVLLPLVLRRGPAVHHCRVSATDPSALAAAMIASHERLDNIRQPPAWRAPPPHVM